MKLILRTFLLIMLMVLASNVSYGISYPDSKAIYLRDGHYLKTSRSKSGDNRYTRLNDLGTWRGGGTPSKSKPTFWEDGSVLWITPKDMKGKYLSDSMDKITDNAVSNSSANYIDANSILIVTRSGILRRTLPISMNTVVTTVNQDLKALTLKDGIDADFVLNALIGLEGVIRENCMKSGTTVESVEFSKLKVFEIGLPPKEEQEEIVRRVEGLFAQATAIGESYEQLKSKIDRLPQAILAKAFRGELVEQLPTDGDAKELLEEIKALKASLKPVKKTRAKK